MKIIFYKDKMQSDAINPILAVWFDRRNPSPPQGA